VYAYLGEEADNSDKVLKFLGKLNRNYPDHVLDTGGEGRFRLEHTNHLDWFRSPGLERLAAAQSALGASPENRSVLTAAWKILCRA
jgi:hypothetical protein